MFAHNGAIIEVDPSTGEQTVISSDSQFNNPTGIAIDACGNLIVTDPGTRITDKVFRVNRSDGAATVLSSSGNFFSPWGVAIVGGGPAPSSARCTLDAALVGRACAGQTVPPSVLNPLNRALDLVDQAGSATGKKATRLLRKAKAVLKKAARAAGKATRKQPKISAECAAQIRLATDGVRAGLGR